MINTITLLFKELIYNYSIVLQWLIIHEAIIKYITYMHIIFTKKPYF